MRETYQPPTTSPTGHPHDRTHSRTLPRHSRVGGNPPRCVQTPGASAPSRRLQNSTQSNRIRQNPTETRVRAFLYSRARARGTAFRWISLGMDCEFDVSLWSCRPIAAMPIHQTEPMGLPQCGNSSTYPEWAPPAKSIRDVLEHCLASPAGGSRSSPRSDSAAWSPPDAAFPIQCTYQLRRGVFKCTSSRTKRRMFTKRRTYTMVRESSFGAACFGRKASCPSGWRFGSSRPA